MTKLLHLVFLILMTASQGAQARAEDVVRIVNRLREPGAACAVSAPALIPHQGLHDAASRIVRGASLQSALKEVGYQFRDANVITLSGDNLLAQLETLLAQRYCKQIGATAHIDIGVHDGRDRILILLAAPLAAPLSLTPAQTAERMLSLVNQARAEPRRCGKLPFDAAPPLRWNQPLERAAASYASDMADHNYFSHTGRDGSTSAQRVTRAGYPYRITGENIAAGQGSPEEAVDGWLGSPTHCANLMNGGFTEMGVAVAVNSQSRMGVYWVQLFGAPR
jgi:uncharacterized protein YkwD